MRARFADERVGYFTTARVDYTRRHRGEAALELVEALADREEGSRGAGLGAQGAHHVLARQEHSREVPQGRRPRACWSGTRPSRRRASATPLVVKQQGPQDSFDTMDARHASVRWFTGADVGFAIGPSQADPRSGEIIDADIGMSDVFARGARRTVVGGPGPARPLRPQRGVHRRPAARAQGLPRLQLRAGGGGRDALRHGPPRGPRPRHGRARGGGARPGLREGRDHARGRAHARAAPQFPRLDDLHPRPDQGPRLHEGERPHDLGHGLQPVQHLAEGRAAGRVRDEHARALRLLGHRVRLPAGGSGRREGGAREDRLALHRAAARLRDGRGCRLRHDVHRHRPRREPLRPRLRPDRLLQADDEALARALGPPAGHEARRGRELRAAHAQLRERLPHRWAAWRRLPRSTSAA